ncbi:MULTISPECIES: glycoside hydrolase family 3 N-terminal domain-containing protein [Acinetobacter]|uniref:beta-N-acetylhexosaminidase n=34 Tax=Acinetobacter baumannii TaxID=470 RepID=A0A6I4HPY8_ACIBA|nr:MULTISPECIES: glycoside hydrolase family 3 N-terminal domain-containing protein [Acinetobacter]AIL80796.1 hypothetical protein IX87_19925 [Acinetobacter baumannii]AIS06551.1 hypothetical protein LX00_09230 [Acinetobacter baumannii]APJ19523.1 hypothetical protein BS064_10620 [Acinetobacter baumannii]ATD21278.1 beta-hexosaminidase [Acinetobacter baumannii]AVO92428.1 beta-hexosaminidase [Acinetobacter baumannii]
MSYTIQQDTYAVLLPAFNDLNIRNIAEPFLRKGGCSILLGETREEYVNRRMNEKRINIEKKTDFIDLFCWAKTIQPNLNVAIDFEPYGINRLDGKVDLEWKDLNNISEKELYNYYKNKALALKQLGITMVLGPIADIITGSNPWLKDRQIKTTSYNISQLVKIFIEALQSLEIDCVTKHFPGYNHLEKDPAMEDTLLTTDKETIISNLVSFSSAIKVNTAGIMLGPAAVEVFDQVNSASTSQKLINFLKEDLNYKGLIVSDDLDAPAILRGKSIDEIAVQALNSGVDLLLLSSENDLDQIAQYISLSVASGNLDRERLSNAANKVRNLSFKKNLNNN